MSLRTAVMAGLTILLLGSAVFAAEKQTVRVERIGDVPTNDIILAPSLATADTCFVSDNGPITWRIDGWVIGFELYKSLMNPANSCAGPYPFTVTAINMPMIFDGPTALTVGVDVEAIDSTTIPGCPIPGVMLALSSEWETQVPGEGLYNIWVPLDTPLVVEGPFFAGFYIGNAVDTSAHAAVLTDDTPVTCATYNIWDEAIGWIDLNDNSIYNFPGRLVMEVAGIPGGSAAVNPILEVLAPAEGDVLLGQQELWAWDRGITGEVDYIMFEYSDGGSFVEIGRDFDGTSPLRDGVHPAVSGNGFSMNWDFSGLPEGYYDLRVTLVDTLGIAIADTINVYLEPTPPIASIVSPTNGTIFCAPIDVSMSCSDENMSFVEVQRRVANILFSSGVVPLSQFSFGDDDGDPTDGNPASGGEFGDYYAAPVAAAMAAQVWSDRGYPGLFRRTGAVQTLEQVVEGFSTAFMTRQTLGSYDEAVMAGLEIYAADHDGDFSFEAARNPEYSDLRIWAEEDERVVLLAIGGNPGVWMTLDGFTGWIRGDDTYLVSVADPLTGLIESYAWRDLAGFSEINFNSTWHRVDLMISIAADDRTISRTLVGADFGGSDGWLVRWLTTGLADGTYHYLRSNGHDADAHIGTAAALVQNNCSAVYVPGDYNDDRTASIVDLYVLIEYIVHGGDAPFGGAARADANCDQAINIADVIYYLNYLFGSAGPPCQ